MEIDYEKFFKHENIMAVNEELNGYLPELFAQDENLEITINMAKIEKEIKKMNSSVITKLFIDYQQLLYEENLQHNWLAYYIGFKNGTQYNKK